MAPDGVRSRSRPVDLIERLSRGLAAADVRYCHWKSNEAIARSLSAENDLDLLLDRSHLSPFLQVATGLGFRIARPSHWRPVPGHLALYGLDVESGRMVQIDAQTRLVLGDDTTKNYRIPIEDAYLDELDDSGVLPLPRPELEYLVFVLRMVLKHCPWDAQLSYKARLTRSERRELSHLQNDVDPARVDIVRAQLLPVVDSRLWERCELALGRELSPLARVVVARELARALEQYGRHPAGVDTGMKLYRRISGRVRRRLSPFSGKKHLAGGGSVVALVGGDGAGKSSAVDDLATFLRRHFVTARFHLGKPSPSLLRWFVTKVSRRLPGRGPSSGIPPWEAEKLERFPGYRYLVVHLLTARDRYRTSLAAFRAAERGAIAVCDRFPLPGIQTMDCPRLLRLPGLEGRPVARWMSRLEAGYYRRIGVPDTVLVLKVDPDVAAARRSDQEPEFVRRRAAEMHERDWKEPNVFVVDANLSMAQVQHQVRSLVWSRL